MIDNLSVSVFLPRCAFTAFYCSIFEINVTLKNEADGTFLCS